MVPQRAAGQKTTLLSGYPVTGREGTSPPRLKFLEDKSKTHGKRVI
jgi:hypothetical protein